MTTRFYAWDPKLSACLVRVMPSATDPGLPVWVRLFAALREAMGWSEQRVTVSDATTPLILWRQLALEPAEPPAGMRVAINQQFATWDEPLQPGDELAFLPPISGG
jgi:molybdopterin synthase sulfur carrier subunit